MALVVIDASVLIALLHPGDALHISAMAAFNRYAGDDLKIPASAYSECLVAPARLGHLQRARASIASLLVEVVPITGEIVEDAAQLRARHPKLRLPDALVVATASVLGAQILLTGDAAWRGLGKFVSVL